MGTRVDLSLSYIYDIRDLINDKEILERVIENPTLFKVSIRQMEKNRSVDLFGVENEIRQIAIKQKEVIDKKIDEYNRKIKALWV